MIYIRKKKTKFYQSITSFWRKMSRDGWPFTSARKDFIHQNLKSRGPRTLLMHSVYPLNPISTCLPIHKKRDMQSVFGTYNEWRIRWNVVSSYIPFICWFFLCISGWPEQQQLLAGDRVVYRLSYLMATLFTWGFFPFIQTTTLSVEFIHKNDDDGAAM